MNERTTFEYRQGVPYSREPHNSPYQTVDIWTRGNVYADTSLMRKWIILIHGGIWRDPDITAESFAQPAISVLEEDTSLCDLIDGFASLNYRLSPYPEHPTNPSKPDDPWRTVQHPTHLNDTLAGIKYLQERFKFGNRYIIIGHSCGATLSFQALQTLLQDSANSEVSPQAVVGIAGLYDLVRLRDTDAYPPMYEKLISNAFGSDEGVWKSASPADESFRYDSWTRGKAVILARCEEDEYVPTDQFSTMRAKIQCSEWAKRPDVVLKEVVLNGRHDDCWKEGGGLAKCIGVVLQSLQN